MIRLSVLLLYHELLGAVIVSVYFCHQTRYPVELTLEKLSNVKFPMEHYYCTRFCSIQLNYVAQCRFHRRIGNSYEFDFFSCHHCSWFCNRKWATDSHPFFTRKVKIWGTSISIPEHEDTILKMRSTRFKLVKVNFQVINRRSLVMFNTLDLKCEKTLILYWTEYS